MSEYFRDTDYLYKNGEIFGEIIGEVFYPDRTEWRIRRISNNEFIDGTVQDVTYYPENK